MIDILIDKARPDVEIRGVDVLVRPSAQIKVRAFVGRKLLFGNRSFDTVMFVDVPHHTDDPTIRLVRVVVRRYVFRRGVVHACHLKLAYGTERVGSRVERHFQRSYDGRTAGRINSSLYGLGRKYPSQRGAALQLSAERRWQQACVEVGFELTSPRKLGPLSILFFRHS